jgi:hypothetical protein
VRVCRFLRLGPSGEALTEADRSRLASGAAGGTVKIWDATPVPAQP